MVYIQSLLFPANGNPERKRKKRRLSPGKSHPSLYQNFHDEIQFPSDSRRICVSKKASTGLVSKDLCMFTEEYQIELSITNTSEATYNPKFPLGLILKITKKHFYSRYIHLLFLCIIFRFKSVVTAPVK